VKKNFQRLIKRAEIIIEALPYIKKFFGQTFVIKYGGAATADEKIEKNLAEDVMLLKYIGINPVVVHGGGPQVTAWLKKIGKEPRFVEGLRVTDAETMEVAEMILAGRINKSIVRAFTEVGAKAVGLSGKDGGLIECQKKQFFNRKGEKIDLGQVGEIVCVNRHLLDTLMEKDYIPVISSIGVDREGLDYNVNADEVASAIAATLKASKLILLTDVDGVLKNGQLVPKLTLAEIQKMIQKKQVTGGMMPKVRAAASAIEKKVTTVHIINGRIPHAILLEIFTDTGIGTMIKRSAVR
jgi:acetylglutamate kinase